MVRLVAFAAGLIFGMGLCLSGMIYPAKVLGFLDIAGNWDPSLALVMAAGLAVSFLGFRLVAARGVTVLGGRLDLPPKSPIDPPLLIGSGIFGIGWGLAGFCPGPALAGLGFFSPEAGIFVLAMIAGMVFHDRIVMGGGLSGLQGLGRKG